MRSGNPDPDNDLKVILESKKSQPSETVEVVSQATRWMKAQLKGANITYNYSACDTEDHYGHAVFSIVRNHKGNPVALDLKIAEIESRPYAFAEVLHMGRYRSRLFPYFGDISSEEEKTTLLHYVSDFILSTSPKQNG